MTAPVSLAELRVWATKQMPVQCEYSQDCETCGRGRAVLALVELAEAYLETRPGIHDSCRPQCKDPDACEAKRQAARARLALAAKGVTR